MDLFEMKNGYVFPSVHALMVQPFKGIWENDTSDNHEYSIKVFTYIELMCSPKKSNIYYKYTDTLIREKKVKGKIFGDEEFPTNTDMMLGTMEYLEQLKDDSISFGIFEDSIGAAEKLRKWLRNFDLNERTPNGAMVLKPADVTRALKEVPDVIKKLEEARKQVISDLSEAGKTRNNRETGMFET